MVVSCDILSGHLDVARVPSGYVRLERGEEYGAH
jgi:hypothetical protein